MPRVTHDGQSFSIDGRRVWVVGASMHYARIPIDLWPRRIADARQAGFNTIEAVCPWSHHEPRKGRFNFTGGCDIKRFVEQCAEAGMWVALRVGPYVGGVYDGGGLPGWLIEGRPVKLREAHEPFLERVTLYLRKLLSEVSDLYVTGDGPILLVQSEHAWLCSNDEQADRYLREVTRHIRENGVNVPIINANDLWQESPGTIDTWRGWDDLLLHLRQLRSLQPGAPRVVSAFDACEPLTWGSAARDTKSPSAVLQHLGQVLAAGAQPIVSPFHAGTNFAFHAGRLAGAADRFITTSAAGHPPLGEAGARGEKYAAIRRLATFASQFGHVFADLDPDYQPAMLDLTAEPGSAGSGAKQPSVSIVPLRGGAGRVAFVFSDGRPRELTLMLDQGLRLPLPIGKQSVSWFVADIDLGGIGRLDYANLCPFALVDRSVLVLFGPARAQAYLSIDGSPLQATVPSAGKPAVVLHKGVTVVLCNEDQIDSTYFNQSTVFVGAAGIDENDEPIPADGVSTIWSITGEAQLQKLSVPPLVKAPRAVVISNWAAVAADDYASGATARYASLDGPDTLVACGAAAGYGWYRMEFKATSTRKIKLLAPHAADRIHLFADGEHVRIIGDGPGADRAPFDLSLAKGEHKLAALADNLGRFSEGNDLGESKGLFGHLYEVKAMKAVKPKKVNATAVDPFTLRGYLEGRARGQFSDTSQLEWSFTHARKTPILVDVEDASISGTFILNDEPLFYFAGDTGSCSARLMLGREIEEARLKRGKNVLRFAPDPRQDRALEVMSKAATLYECTTQLTKDARWSFAKWEPPQTRRYKTITKTDAKMIKGTPCWWRASVEIPETAVPAWFEAVGLSKGQLYLNGENVGRYFAATSDGKAVGPQHSLYLPAPWIKFGQDNEIIVFDEHGFAPHRTRVVFNDAGSLD